MRAPELDQVRRYFDQPARYLNDRNDLAIRQRIEIAQSLLKGQPPPERLLDLGCGDGRISAALVEPSTDRTLVDLSAAMLERARAATPPALALHTQYFCGDLGQLPHWESFDLVLCVGVLAHVPSVEAAVQTVADRTRPGGHCVLQITDAAQWSGQLLDAYYSVRAHFARFSRSVNATTSAQIEAAAKSAGLHLRASQRYSLLLPGMGRLPSRWLEQWELLVREQRWLSRFATERLFLFQK